MAGKPLVGDPRRHWADRQSRGAAAPREAIRGRGDGVRGSLAIRVDASHADQPIVIGWSAVTLPPPVGRGTCLASSQWDATTGRLTLQLDLGAGCQLAIRAS